MDDVELFGHIRDELKLTVRRLLDQLRLDHPADRLYAILFEVDDSGTYAYPIAGSEESLTRLVEKYIAKGYRIQSGDLLESLRTASRWDAPGDDMDGWYWGEEDDQIAVTRLIEQAVQVGLIEAYGEDQPLLRLCLEALRELDSDGVFGSGSAREQVLIGATCCEVGFGQEEEQLEELSTLNSPSTIGRLRVELAAAKATDELLIFPWTNRGRDSG